MAQTKLQRRIEACQTANVDVNAKSERERERERDIANAAYHGFAIMLRERKKSCTSCVPLVRCGESSWLRRMQQ